MRRRSTWLTAAAAACLLLTPLGPALAAEDTPATSTPTATAAPTATPSPTPSAAPVVVSSPMANPAPAPAPAAAPVPAAAATTSAPPPPPPVPQASTPAQAPTHGPWGTDAFIYQHPGGAPINWTALSGSYGGLAFTYLKGSDGLDSTVNRYLAADRAAAHTTGVAVGVYHYAEPGTPVVADAQAQARAAFTAAGKPGIGDLPPALDLEANPNDLSPADLALWAKTWLAATAQLSGRTPVFYTNPGFFTQYVAADPALAAYPLWIAHYGLAVTAPLVPAPWSTWTFWQFSEKGVLPGVQHVADMSVFAGSKQELDLLAGRTPPPTVDHTALTRSSVSLLGNALLASVTGNQG